MSRKISEIQDSIITEKETFSELNSLTPKPDTSQTFLDDIQSPSKVALWRLFIRLIATEIKFHEDLFDTHAAEVEQRAKDIVPATSRSLVIDAKEFQFGDDLIFNETTKKFSYTDTTSTSAGLKRIVTQASVLDANRVVTYKVAKTVAGALAKLDGAELTSFTTYIDQKKVPGTKTVIRSTDADSLKVAYTIEYDPLVLKADGSLIDDGTFPIQEAIDKYIEGLPFDSAFRVQDLTNAIEAARGSVNAIADVVEARDVVASYTDILLINTETFQPFAGYFVTVDETGTEAVPVPGSINVLTPADYNATIFYVIGSFARQAGIVFKSNVAITVPEAFDTTKWDTVSNLTFIST